MSEQLLSVFKSTISSCKYPFKSGKIAYFVGGKYLTAVESEIKELDEEVKSGHPHIYIDAKEKEVSSASADPMAGLRAKFFAEFQAQQLEAAQEVKDFGNTDQSQAKPAATTDLGPQVAGAAQAVKVSIPKK